MLNKPGGMLCQSAEERSARIARETGNNKSVSAASTSSTAENKLGAEPPSPASPAFKPLSSLSYSSMPLSDLAGWHLAHKEGRIDFLHMYHRLDRVASGAVLFVRSQALLPHIDGAWDGGDVERKYLAVVEGVPGWRAKVARAPIGRAPGTAAWKFAETPTGKPARTVFRVVAVGKDYSVIEASPQTGRTHQIRVHLAGLGHPIIGDVLYGATPGRWPLQLGSNGGTDLDGRRISSSGSEYSHRILLHSQRIAFLQPIRHATLSIDAPLPADMASYVNAAAPLEGADVTTAPVDHEPQMTWRQSFAIEGRHGSGFSNGGSRAPGRPRHQHQQQERAFRFESEKG